MTNSCLGTATITFSNGKQITVNFGLNNSITQNGAIGYTTLYTNTQALGTVTSATFNGTTVACAPTKIQINYMSNIVARLVF